MNYLINYIMDRHFPQFDNSRKTIVLILDVGGGKQIIEQIHLYMIQRIKSDILSINWDLLFGL